MRVAAELHHAFLGWFAINARPLPWRQGYDPYQVWLSEIMLQQTQMDRGVIYFKRWVERFPGVEAVAAASEEEILKCWEGLGYYSRARHLLATAKRIVQAHAGRVPDTLPELLALPGIGQYTARAILSIAFQRDYPVVDGNVERLFARLFAIDEPLKSTAVRARIGDLADSLLPRGQAREWNQALMELGALVCVRGAPNCQLCPATTACQSFQTGSTLTRPVGSAARKTVPVRRVTAVIVDNGKIYVQQRAPGSRWAFLWEFPGSRLEEGEEPAEVLAGKIQQETGLPVAIESPLPTVTHNYTKYRATIHPFLCRLQGAPPPEPNRICRWLPLNDLNDLAFSSGHRQVIDSLPDFEK